MDLIQKWILRLEIALENMAVSPWGPPGMLNEEPSARQVNQLPSLNQQCPLLKLFDFYFNYRITTIQHPDLYGDDITPRANERI